MTKKEQNRRKNASVRRKFRCLSLYIPRNSPLEAEFLRFKARGGKLNELYNSLLCTYFGVENTLKDADEIFTDNQ
jgi:hypothetical protein